MSNIAYKLTITCTTHIQTQCGTTLLMWIPFLLLMKPIFHSKIVISLSLFLWPLLLSCWNSSKKSREATKTWNYINPALQKHIYSAKEHIISVSTFPALFPVRVPVSLCVAYDCGCSTNKHEKAHILSY